MTPEENKQPQPKLYEAKEAAEYLSRQWGIPYNTAALKKLRQRRGIVPYFQGEKIVLYSEEQLKLIPKPGALRKGRQKRGRNEDEEGSKSSSVTYARRSYSAAALGATA